METRTRTIKRKIDQENPETKQTNLKRGKSDPKAETSGAQQQLSQLPGTPKVNKAKLSKAKQFSEAKTPRGGLTLGGNNNAQVEPLHANPGKVVSTKLGTTAEGGLPTI